MIHKKVADQFLRTLDKIEHGGVELVTPEGMTYTFSGKKAGPFGKIHIRDWSVVSNLTVKGDVALAEDYRDGKWETEDLTSLLLLSLQNEQALAQYIFGGNVGNLLSRISYLFRSNTLKGSRNNILQHYDLGNQFYKLWLDESMTYSSAIFQGGNETLTEAQNNKYDRIIKELGKDSGKLLEIGCGWGGFAERASQKGDFDIKGITISDEQHKFASQRLGGNAEIVIEDYRLQIGKFDHIVSIEMFEAVGERYWKTYFNQIKALLKEDGKAVIQTITINDRHFDKYRRTGDMIRSLIFPGGMLPSPSRFKEEVNRAGLEIDDMYFFGLDYAKTLQVWLDKFEDSKDELIKLGFDDSFIRLWRFYLSACIASFASGKTNVMQVSVRHA